MEFRELAPEEIPQDIDLPDGGAAIGAIENGKVIALLGAYPVLFLDPLWIDPEFRHRSVNFSIIKGLWDAVKARLSAAGVSFVVGHADDSQPRMARLLGRIGTEITGKRQFIIPTGGN